ncbi:MAG: homocysteine S-methyltransferase family protein [Sphingomonas sp.]|jgi:S-methylmethionine-dependent homocysteine/selenocysteine methylase
MSVTILDGGISRELQRLGAPFRQPEWSALALIEKPELVADAHDLFAVAGANVITTNSYAIVPFHIGAERFARDGARLAALCGELARNVADKRNIKVAASLPPVLGSYRPDLFDADEARPILDVLITGLSPYGDIWLAETLSTLAEARLIAEMLAGDSRPLWLSFTLDDSAATGPARLRSGEDVEAAAALANAVGAKALLFNCSKPEVMAGAVRAAKAALEGVDIAIGVYANGFGEEDDGVAANEVLRAIRPDLDPPHYLAWAKKWVEAGATIVGGCCGIGPDHIAALAKAFRS